MARRIRHRRKRSVRFLLIIQIVLLSLVLLIILFFRDLIATGASEVVGTFGAQDDIQVQAPADTGATGDKKAPNKAPKPKNEKNAQKEQEEPGGQKAPGTPLEANPQ